MRRLLAVAALVVLAAVACSDGVDIDVASSGTTAPRPAATVEVFLLTDDAADCGLVEPVERVVGEATLEAVLGELVSGVATPGHPSMFTAGTAGTVRSAVVQDGVAYVDFDDFSGTIPNASASCGSTALLAQLDATVTAFGGVEGAVYSFEGDRQAFYEWLQLDVPDAG